MSASKCKGLRDIYEGTIRIDPNAIDYYISMMGLDRKNFSMRMGKNRNYIQQICKQRSVRAGTLAGVADALGVTVNDLAYTPGRSMRYEKALAGLKEEPLTRVTNGPPCNQMGKCFARSENGRCSLLTEIYTGRKCPFQKERRGQ